MYVFVVRVRIYVCDMVEIPEMSPVANIVSLVYKISGMALIGI